MEGKDNRSKSKRSKMKQFHTRKAQAHRPSLATTTSSSSIAPQPQRGIADLADSSDEIYNNSRRWSKRSSVGGSGGAIVRSGPIMPPATYDDDDDYTDNVAQAQLRAADFDVMSQMPTSIGGHFQFPDEKSWECSSNKPDAGQYFTMNLKLISAGLHTIPFYKRMEYPASMFSKEQLAIMEQEAEVAEKHYQGLLLEQEKNPRIKINSGSRKSGSGSGGGSASGSARDGSGKSAEATKSQASEEPDELDELLSMATSQVAKVHLNAAGDGNGSRVQPGNGNSGGGSVGNGVGSSRASVVSNKDDVQDWLDSVLNE